MQSDFLPSPDEPPATLYEDVRLALRLYGTPDNQNPLQELLTFQPPDGQASVRQFVDERLLGALQELASLHAQEAELLRLRYVENLTADTVGYRLGMSTPNLNKKQRKALQLLGGQIWQSELAARRARQAHFLNRLEAPTYDRLFGVDKLADQLLQLLTKPGPPWLAALEGMGGLGKTALADAVMRRAIAQQRFGGYGWVSARQQRFHLAGAITPLARPALSAEQLIEQLAAQIAPQPATEHGFLPPVLANEATLLRLTDHLQTAPHLIVVDNLETVGDLEALLPTLQRLANPTKFLLTSRAHIHSETATYPLPVPELCEADALALVRHEAELRNQPELAQIDARRFGPIYAAVGGNPLALRLVVGQTHIHSLPLVLDDLQMARGQPVQNLYTYIYRQAWTWLDETGRELLLAMLHADPQGEELDYIVGVSGLKLASTVSAMNDLVRLNLVDARGALAQRQYSIHALTRSFLHEQVLQWQA
ncbi:MAG: NB-ARC domain-containing protein [Caldilineaceae bacterium]